MVWMKYRIMVWMKFLPKKLIPTCVRAHNKTPNKAYFETYKKF